MVGSPHEYVSMISAESLLLRKSGIIWNSSIRYKATSVFKLGSEKVQVAGSGKHDCACN